MRPWRSGQDKTQPGLCVRSRVIEAPLWLLLDVEDGHERTPLPSSFDGNKSGADIPFQNFSLSYPVLICAIVEARLAPRLSVRRGLGRDSEPWTMGVTVSLLLATPARASAIVVWSRMDRDTSATLANTRRTLQLCSLRQSGQRR